MISYGRQCIDQNDIDAVINVLKGDWLTCGPYVADFEKNYKNALKHLTFPRVQMEQRPCTLLCLL
jgi:dTDP-4-amino-4,6-dideoxygalactose transaminase